MEDKIKSFISESYNIDILLGGEKSELYFAVIDLIRKFTIRELEDCIEHPTKPGYRRHDILNKIKLYKK